MPSPSAGEPEEHREATPLLAAADKQVLGTFSPGPLWGEAVGAPRANRANPGGWRSSSAAKLPPGHRRTDSRTGAHTGNTDTHTHSPSASGWCCSSSGIAAAAPVHTSPLLMNCLLLINEETALWLVPCRGGTRGTAGLPWPRCLQHPAGLLFSSGCSDLRGHGDLVPRVLPTPTGLWGRAGEATGWSALVAFSAVRKGTTARPAACEVGGKEEKHQGCGDEGKGMERLGSGRNSQLSHRGLVPVKGQIQLLLLCLWRLQSPLRLGLPLCLALI